MLYLYGASGHAKVIIEIAELHSISIGGLFDANPKINQLLGYPVSNETPLFAKDNKAEYIVSIGNNKIRKKIVAELNANFITLMHPKSAISKRVDIGEGTVVMAGVSINSSSTIGRHVIVNTNASIDHDCVIEDYVHIAPNASLAGNVQVGEGTHVGIGTAVIQGIRIGKWCTIGAGTVLINDVPDYAVVVGNPGRIIKMENTSNEKRND